MIMKKTFITLVVIIACITMASSVFAAITISTGNTTKIGGANFVPSTNVSICPTAVATAYCASSVHKSSTGPSASGGREWGTYTGGASAIFYTDATLLAAGAECDACQSESQMPNRTWTAQ
jgi:hypothetical protein